MSIKKYFIYQIKIYWRVAVALTALSLAATVLTFLFGFMPTSIGYPAPRTSFIELPITILVGLCVLMPIIMFAFKTSPRQLDLLYSLPINIKEIYLVKTLVGLICTIVPFTASIWCGVLIAAVMPQRLAIGGYIEAYFIGVALAVLLWGFNTFIFTRANRVTDGIIFMIAFAFIGFLVFNYINTIATLIFVDRAWLLEPPILPTNPMFYSPYAAFLALIARQEYIILANYATGLSGMIEYQWISFIFLVLIGIGGWTGLFLTANKQKAENSGRLSDTFWGYRTIIPILACFGLIALNMTILGFFFFVFLALFHLAGFAAFIIYRRSIKLKWYDIVSLSGSLLLALVLSFIVL